ncbi:hypothetical protein SAY87_017255 [Trapa incisa]|uniref:Protein BIG GRAIN 1-like B n=1 Tax=Trapa incisa TaxID=236973 RepID=A0AAN7LAR7_9MYRT|nr:hypothetical protein SAY87_017255 [Trapa incisa]
MSCTESILDQGYSLPSYYKSSMRGHGHQNCPSFSSTLLDAIYRSIDDEAIDRGALKGQGPKMLADGGRQISAYGIESSWLNKRHNEPVTTQRNSAVCTGRNLGSFCNSSPSSSETSSNRGGFSSSDSGNCYSSCSESKSRTSSSCYSMNKLKPIRTSVSGDRLARPRMINLHGEDYDSQVHQVVRPNNFRKQEGGAVKERSKALKIYEDFKRMKGGSNNRQPISPGAKIAGFLNALFSAKKAKHSSAYSANFPAAAVVRVPEPGDGYPSTCSSASSFSRSCLSNTPSSRGKVTDNDTKRSVRFCPVNVILNEDTWPGDGHDHIHLRDRHRQQSNPKTARNYPWAQENQGLFHVSEDQEEEEEKDDDDGASCASSDLFELENLSRIEIGGGLRFNEELPVYETTSLDTNRAIAKGLVKI